MTFSMCDSSMGELEALIQRHAPKMMKAGSGLGTGEIRAESRPKRISGKPNGFVVVTDDMKKEIIAMAKQGWGPTDIGAHFRINDERVRAFIKGCKQIVKPSKEELSALRRSPHSGTTMVRIK
jgi:hypothetical protein